MIKIKRVYAPPEPADGTRILTDRLWPRGIARETARIDEWCKEIAPSSELRQWFGHDPAKWAEFRVRYLHELAAQGELLARLRQLGRQGTVTLLFAAKEEVYNHTVLLRELLEQNDGTGTFSP